MALRFEEAASYEEMSERCANQMIDVVARKPEAVMILATGYSPLLAYRRFVDKARAEHIDTSRIVVIKLDEWVGLAQDDPSTCEAFLRREVLAPLRVAEDRYLSFDTACSDPEAESARVSQAVHAQSAIDLVVLGIGKNGHVGLNEPGTELILGAHLTVLAEPTRRHAMLAQSRRKVNLGMTIGLDELFLAREIMLLATGEGKASAIQYLRKGKVNTQIPASLLHLHGDAVCYVDRSIN